MIRVTGARRRTTPSVLAVAVAVAVVLLTACAGPAGAPASVSSEGNDMTITVTSTAFTEGATIPDEFTCRGAGGFPGISWTGDLGGATALAVVVDDPDAPNGTFTHLVVLDLPVATTSLAQPTGGTVALNSAGSTGWTPPCPPSGTHHYRFTVYGLSAPTGLGADAKPAAAVAAIQALAVAQGTLTGLVPAQ